MPLSAKSVCRAVGCSRLAADGFCENCKAAGVAAAAIRARQARPSSAQRGYGARWQKVREHFLRAHPLCVDPFSEHGGRPTAAEVVDHRVPHKGDQALFWNAANWQPLCKRCHDRKTAIEDGAFGRL